MAEDWLESAAAKVRESADTGAPPPAPAEPWLPDVAKRLRENHQQRLETNLTASSSKPPAQVAQIRQDARKAGIPLPLAERDPEATRKARVAQAARELAAQKDTPATKRAFQDPAFADIAHDRVEGLSTLERYIRLANPVLATHYAADYLISGEEPRSMVAGKAEQLIEAPTTAAAGVAQATLGMAESVWRTPEAAARYLESLARSTERFTGLPKAVNPVRALQYTAEFAAEGRVPGTDIALGGTSDIAKRIGDTTTMLAQDTATFGDAFARLTEKAKTADAAFASALEGDAAPLGEVLTDPEAWAGFMGQAAPSLLAAWKSGGSVPFIAWLEGMEGASNAIEFEERTGQKITPEQFVQATAQAATINAFLEKLGLDEILRVGKGAPLSAFIRSGLAEGATEGAQALNSNLAAMAAYNPEQSLAEGILPGIMGGFASGGGLSAGMAALNEQAKQAELRQQTELNTVLADAAKAMQATDGVDRLEALAQAAQTEELRTRDPEAFAQFVERAIGEDAGEVSIEAAKLAEVFQQAGRDPAEVLAEAPEVLSQFGEALATGGDVRVPMGFYVTHLATDDLHGEIAQHVRMTPDAMSGAEAQKWQEEDLAVFEQRAQEAIAARRAEAPPAGEPTAPQRIFDRMAEQLGAIEQDGTTGAVSVFTRKGKVAKRTAQAYASLHRAVATALEARGVDPMRFYGNLFIEGTEPTGGFQFDEQGRPLQQGPMDATVGGIQVEEISNEEYQRAVEQYAAGDVRPGGLQTGEVPFRTLTGGAPDDAWSTATGIKRNGRPALVYRGGRAGLGAGNFDPAALGTATGHPTAGLGVYFTSDHGDAAGYGPTVDAVHLDVRNPAIYTTETIPEFTDAAEAFDFREGLRLAGHDGIVFDYRDVGGPVHFVAFDAEQVIHPPEKGELMQADTSYRIEHTAPVRDGANTADDATDVYPDDVYDPTVAWNYYGHGGDTVALDKASAKILAALRGKPSAKVTIYRAVPKGVTEINPGDWVTINRDYAKFHGESWVDRGAGEGYDIIELEVRADEIATDGNSIHEWGYSPAGFEQRKAAGPRGKISFAPELTSDQTVISLLEGADLSTFLHESGHWLFEVWRELANDPETAPQFKGEMDALLEFVGVESLDEWNRMSLEQRREGHEQVARAFEAYLFEGKAPTKGLRKLFQTFATWLRKVYTSLKALDVELTDEVRQVFDRMVATEEQIAATQAPAYAEEFMRENMTEEEFAEYQQLIEASREDAIADLQARSLRDMRWLTGARNRALKALQTKARDTRKRIREAVEAEMLNADKEPVYAAWAFLKHAKLAAPDGTVHKLDPVKLSTAALRAMYEPEGPKPKAGPVDSGVDPLHIAIAKLGGLDREEAEAQGIDPAYWTGKAGRSGRMQPFVGKPVFRKEGGRSFDAMAEALSQYGYLSEPYTVNELLDKLDEGLETDVFSMEADPAVYGVDDRYEADTPDWRALGGPYGLISSKADRIVAPDEVAEMFGLSSGDELVRGLLDATPFEQEVEARVDQRMIEEHAELSDQAAIEQAADAAVHNVARQKAVALELKALSELARIRAIDKKAAREYALAALANVKVRDIQPHTYVIAERRAAKASTENLRKGETLAAARAKQDQFINGELVRAAHKARTEIEKAVKYLKKFESPGVRKNLRGDAVEQIDQLLARFDLRKGVTLKAIDERVALKKWVEDFAAENAAISPDIDEKFLNEAHREHYRNMPLRDLRGLVDTVKSLEKLARREQQMYLDRKNQTFAEEKNALLNELRDAHPEAFDKDGEPLGFDKSYVPGVREKVKRIKGKATAELLNPETIVQVLGLGKFGALHDSIIGRLSERSDWKVSFLQTLGDHIAPLFKAYTFKESQEFGSKAIYIEAVGTSLTREQIVNVALYYGSETGRQRLKDGHGWGDAQVQAILDKLTEKDVALVKGIWYMHDELIWPELEAVNERTTGQKPEKVQPLAFETKFGTLQGGYHPLVYDADLDFKAGKYAEGEAVQQMLGGNVWKASTPQGSSKARLEQVSKRLVLDFTGMSKAVGDTVHDIAYREAVADTYRILTDKGIRSALDTLAGPDVSKALEQWVRNTAAVPRAPQGFIERSMSWARRNTLIVAMGFSIKTFLINMTGIFASAARVSPQRLAREYGPFAAGPREYAAFIHERSEYMANRNKAFDRDLSRQVQQFRAKRKLTPDVATALVMVGWMDRAVAYPTWMAAYKEALNGMADGVAPADSDRAAEYADHVVRQTQGSGREVDVARIMEGGGMAPLKNVFTMFYSYFNAQLGQLVRSNVVRRSEMQAAQGADKVMAVAKMAGDFAAIVLLPAISAALLYGNCDADVEAEGAAEGYARCFARESVLFAGGFVPIVRDVVAAMWRSLDDNAPYYGYQISPAQSAFEGIVRGATSAVDAAMGEGDEKDLKNMVLGASYALGLPGYQIWRTMEHGIHVADGTSEFNPWHALMGEPKD